MAKPEFFIFEQGYCAMQKRDSDDKKNNLPIGYLVPSGTDAASKKRKAGADDWAKRCYGGKSTLPSVEFDNKPEVGFEILDGCRTASQGGGETAFRIKDPRGVELEIRASNLTQILLSTTVANGEIMDECVWARKGATNWLLPTSSELYKQAKAETDVKTSTVKAKDVKVGYTVKLQNGIEGRYLGYFPVWEHTEEDRYRYNSNLEFNKTKKKHWFLCKFSSKWKTKGKEVDMIRSVSSPKWSSIVDKSELTPEEVSKIIHKHIASGGLFGEGRVDDYSYHNKIAFATDEIPTWSLVPTTKEEAIKRESGYNRVSHIVESDEGLWLTTIRNSRDGQYYYNGFTIDGSSVIPNVITRDNICMSGVEKEDMGDWYGRGAIRWEPTNPKWYAIQVEVDGYKYFI